MYPDGPSRKVDPGETATDTTCASEYGGCARGFQSTHPGYERGRVLQSTDCERDQVFQSTHCARGQVFQSTQAIRRRIRLVRPSTAAAHKTGDFSQLTQAAHDARFSVNCVGCARSHEVFSQLTAHEARLFQSTHATATDTACASEYGGCAHGRGFQLTMWSAHEVRFQSTRQGSNTTCAFEYGGCSRKPGFSVNCGGCARGQIFQLTH